MLIEHFIMSKPPELRLGQYFMNTYMSKLSANTNLHKCLNDLYFTRNEENAISGILEIMAAYQWEELPDVD